jgi:hypothetical protein
MKRTLLSSAAALLLLAVPAAAQNGKSQNNNSKTLDPNKLTVEVKKPKLDLNDQQRTAIVNALVEQHTQQKAPKDFQPQVGATLPKPLKVDVMPLDLIRKQPALKDYGYAKTEKNILVLDPMSKKIVAVLPRKFPGDAQAKPMTPSDWAQSHTQELTGHAPRDSGKENQDPKAAGDPAAVGNGTAENGQPQDSGLQPGYQNKH